MSDLGMDLQDSDRKVILRFEKFPADMHDRLLETLTRLERRLEGAVIAQEPERTGMLRSITGGRVYDHGDRIAAVVGVRAPDPNEAKKAAALEFGSHRSIAVRAHEAKLTHLWGRAISPMMVQVPLHQRLSNLDPRRFLRGPIEAMHGEAIAELRAAVDRVTRSSA